MLAEEVVGGVDVLGREHLAHEPLSLPEELGAHHVADPVTADVSGNGADDEDEVDDDEGRCRGPVMDQWDGGVDAHGSKHSEGEKQRVSGHEEHGQAAFHEDDQCDDPQGCSTGALDDGLWVHPGGGEQDREGHEETRHGPRLSLIRVCPDRWRPRGGPLTADSRSEDDHSRRCRADARTVA